jgi:hypothetical protein
MYNYNSSYKCFPYSYGDPGGTSSIPKKVWKVFFLTLFATSSIYLIPSVANANNTTEILLRIEKAVQELDRTSLCIKGISPIAGVAYIVSGICIAKSQQAFSRGDLPVAVTFACSAAAFACGERMAAYKGL